MLNFVKMPCKSSQLLLPLIRLNFSSSFELAIIHLVPPIEKSGAYVKIFFVSKYFCFYFVFFFQIFTENMDIRKLFVHKLVNMRMTLFKYKSEHFFLIFLHYFFRSLDFRVIGIFESEENISKNFLLFTNLNATKVAEELMEYN